MKSIPVGWVFAAILFALGVFWALFTIPDRRITVHWWRKRNEAREIPLGRIFLAVSPLFIWGAAVWAALRHW